MITPEAITLAFKTSQDKFPVIEGKPMTKSVQKINDVIDDLLIRMHCTDSSTNHVMIYLPYIDANFSTLNREMITSCIGDMLAYDENIVTDAMAAV